MEKVGTVARIDEKSMKKKKFAELLASKAFFIISLLSVISLLLIMGFIFAGTVPAIKEIGLVNFLFGRDWKPVASPPSFGIFPMIVGSILVTLGSVVIGLPIGLLTAIFLSYFCPAKIYKPVKQAINLMAGIPSIVFGYFTVMVVVPVFRGWFGGTGMSMFTAMVLLGTMILPTIISISETSIQAVEKDIYQGALALGASHEEAVLKCVVPAAKSGIVASVILGVGRAIGETMAVVMVAGNQPKIPGGLFEGVRTMTANIVMEMNYAAGLHREALIATGAVLFVFILIINLVFNYYSKKES